MKEGIEKVKALAKAIRIAMLTTVSEDGQLRSRPMALNDIEEDGTMWFFTGKDSEKVEEIEEYAKVNVNFADNDDNDYLSVAGKAELVLDKAIIKDKFNRMTKAWFPEGTESDNISLLRVTPNSAEYWDGGDNKMVQLFHLGKALLTGKKYQGGRHEEVTM